MRTREFPSMNIYVMHILSFHHAVSNDISNLSACSKYVEELEFPPNDE